MRTRIRSIRAIVPFHAGIEGKEDRPTSTLVDGYPAQLDGVRTSPRRSDGFPRGFVKIARVTKPVDGIALTKGLVASVSSSDRDR